MFWWIGGGGQTGVRRAGDWAQQCGRRGSTVPE